MTRARVPSEWFAAVDAGGAGWAARAFGELDECARAARPGGDNVVASLGLSTRASLYRQAGRHREALPMDGSALRLVGVPGGRVHGTPAPEAGVGGRWRAAAAVDALVGLAADNLGRGEFGASRRLLNRAAALVVGADPSQRAGADSAHCIGGDAGEGAEEAWWTGTRGLLRWRWVNAELGLYGGDMALAAEHSRAALELVASASALTPTRHRVKTELIGAAVEAGSGRVGEAVALARGCRADAAGAGLLPLEWAALSMLCGLEPGKREHGADLQRVRAELVARGMPFDAGRDAVRHASGG